MGWQDWASVVGGVGGIALDMTHKSRSTASDQANDRDSAESKAQQQYDAQRRSANTNYDHLKSEHTTGYDAPVVVGDKLEAFNTWQHSRIWNAMNDAGSPTAASQINDAATGWAKLADDTDTACNEFKRNVDQSVQAKMAGRTAQGFLDASDQFCAEMGKLTVAQRLVSRGLSYHADYLGQAKASIAPPPGSGGITDAIVQHLPFQGIFKGPHYRAQEAEHEAQRVMTDVYQKNIVSQVDNARPVLPTPASPVSNSGIGVSNSGIGVSNSGSGSGPAPVWNGGGSGSGVGYGHDSGSGLGGGNGSGSAESGGGSGADSSADASGNQGPGLSGSGTQTTPSGLGSSGLNTTPADYSGPGTGTGGLGTGTGTGTGGLGTGGGMGGLGPGGVSGPSGGAGQSIPGPIPSGTATGRAATAAAGANRANSMMGGMPNAGKGKEDDKEHKTKDYLVYDRESELLGKLPPVLPPGGVIG